LLATALPMTLSLQALGSEQNAGEYTAKSGGAERCMRRHT
jgi:hypothetical protein